MQNTSHAVMAQRTEGKKSLDDFPTPLWATRALIEEVIGKDRVTGQTCLEPACGRGHMAVSRGGLRIDWGISAARKIARPHGCL